MHFRMQYDDDVNNDVDVTYRTLNMFSTDGRFIYFMIIL